MGKSKRNELKDGETGLEEAMSGEKVNAGAG